MTFSSFARKACKLIVRTAPTRALLTIAVTFSAAHAQGTHFDPAKAATAEQQWNREVLASGQVEALSASMARNYREAAASVDESMISKVRKSLPTLDQLGSSLKYGNYVAVSPQGAETVSLIRAVPMRTGVERNATLAKLIQLSKQGVPEAQNFSGFVYQYGLFGAQKNLSLARQYYTASASRRYQPAVYNLANMAYFGDGQARDIDTARELVNQATSLGVEASGRVCGLASFIEYRLGDQDGALRYGRNCFSPLAHIPNAAYNNKLPLVQRIKMLRDSIGTGAPDGYRWLEQITQRAGPDPDYLYCKYRLINQLQVNPRANVQALAKTCFENTTPPTNATNATNAANVIQGITGFVVVEVPALRQSQVRLAPQVRRSVPYLPFGQADFELYEPVMKEVK
jgi:TPR repeat protein